MRCAKRIAVAGDGDDNVTMQGVMHSMNLRFEQALPRLAKQFNTNDNMKDEMKCTCSRTWGEPFFSLALSWINSRRRRDQEQAQMP